ncbi:MULTISPECIES: winged helix-turn-helix transcriptional regulator [Streptomyces]|uniref:Winged helix-turn-helix transcriptional regulator n=1 Tax=Streptomyces koelreuteriae TaxID=2838015 RepID=A0ABX8FMB8_9ACTN|nr:MULTISPECIES: winged helix-turn-helix transcriptional regulator [Streptomyces]QWB22179.1 winged helix-turn-helix transcriptional regulator [Streptomyces koelreuteriae]UUA05121.1 winged helix-turn-helix transcriptional regulator [Streptomyces koelreuteriae]UUA12746.1 winged helix-turn-helix transcriptional regulator [Streptomyces sp. CRCS-T-1]
MVRSVPQRDAACAIAQAAAVVGDWWSLLLVRETARGHHRFDALQGELGISRKVLTERLAHLVESEVLARVPYQTGPVRYEYRLTESGRGLLPVLLAMQDWADRWLLGDGSLSGTADADSAEALRVAGLVGERLPVLELPGHRDGEPLDPVAEAAATVLFCYPATGRPAPLPDGWADIPGAIGCTLENRLFRDAYDDFRAAGAEVRGVSTQRPDEQRVFAAEEGIPFTLLSDVDLRLAAALRLPVFRAGQALRVKRAVLVVDRERVVRQAHFPVTDIPGAVREALAVVRAVAAGN